MPMMARCARGEVGRAVGAVGEVACEVERVRERLLREVDEVCEVEVSREEEEYKDEIA